MRTIESDYLVVGAGAMGMAFIDTLVSETEARVVLVDRHHTPGGHWTMAYPIVRLPHAAKLDQFMLAEAALAAP
ncbi:hypothetical protein A5782_08240 [Mycobacterium sp. 852002-40037_SCH5390672]|nr:hypothetical protein A5782_08240 [Mycobacterium sp. 852002-40037_SCH5390672]